jgi:carbonic anhydrase
VGDIISISIKVLGANWVYREDEVGLYGPSQWGQVNANCVGQRQSPINIVTSSAVPTKRTLPLRTEGVDKVAVTTTYKNDGHGFAAQTVYSDGMQPNVTGGPLGTGKFTFYNFHIHWPSEHTLDGVHTTAELHIVHYNLKYGSLSAALPYPDGLAVVGIFLAVSLFAF